MLHVTGLEAGYGNIRVLKGIDMHVRRGVVTALIGANGAGKSTLIRTISGQIPPTAGRIRFLDEDIHHRPAHVIARLGLVQVPEGRQVLSRMSVLENLEMGAFTRTDGDVGADIDRLFRRFPRLAERKRQPAGTLSGGEQQMVAMARALMARPKLLLLDEPSMGLAPIVVADIFRLIAEIASEGMTILLVEQNARQALRIADYAYVMETGRIALHGPASQLLNDPSVIAAYLGGTADAASTRGTIPGANPELG